jgi:hypothetical protein
MGEINSENINADKYENDQIGLRRARYPSIEDQLDMIWHAIDEGKLNKNSEFYKTIKDIKDQFPTKL